MKTFRITLIDNHIWKGRILYLNGLNVMDAMVRDGWGCECFDIIAPFEEI